MCQIKKQSSTKFCPSQYSFEFCFQNGNGTYYFIDGRIYKGSWKNGKQVAYIVKQIQIECSKYQSGSGSLTWPDGDSYVGAWEDGLRQGWGAYYWNNGNSYQVKVYAIKYMKIKE